MQIQFSGVMLTPNEMKIFYHDVLPRKLPSGAVVPMDAVGIEIPLGNKDVLTAIRSFQSNPDRNNQLSLLHQQAKELVEVPPKKRDLRAIISLQKDTVYLLQQAMMEPLSEKEGADRLLLSKKTNKGDR